MSKSPAKGRKARTKSATGARSGAKSRATPRTGIKAAGGAAPAMVLEFADNSLLGQLFGDHDRNLARIENDLGVAISARGNRVAITGNPEQAQLAADVLQLLYGRLEHSGHVDRGEVDATVRLAAQGRVGALTGAARGGGLETTRRRITPRTPTQGAYLDAMRDHELVVALGPAGTGKTYLAVANAVALMRAGEVDRIILSRPAVEAGERLGFLPGDIREKVDPYLRPLYDALYDMLPADQVVKRLASGEIEVAPLAFMRGRTLSHAFVILDEAQNTTQVQMKMFLTRMGEGTRMVVTGDLSQVDLPPGTRSGLADAVDALDGVKDVGFVRFTAADTVRHPLVTKVVNAYEAMEKRRAGKKATATGRTGKSRDDG